VDVNGKNNYFAMHNNACLINRRRKKMLEPLNVNRQMLDFQKQAVNNFQNMWDFAQAQTSTTVDRLMDQAAWIPQESRQAFENWRSHMKQERERFSAYVDQCFVVYEKMLDAPQSAAPAKTKKTNDTK
jgi:hypothetical protein